MRKADIKKGKLYEAAGMVLECLDLGEGRFPRVPKFRVIYPFRGPERLMQPREISRELSDRESEAWIPKVADAGR